MDLDIPLLLQDRATTWAGDEGRWWLRSLPETVEGLLSTWGLSLDRSLNSHVSFVAAVTRHDGTPAVLKIPLPVVDLPYPQASARVYEASALRSWDGRGAVKALDSDDLSNAMLLEACQPGTALVDLVTLEDADQVAIDLLPQLWQATPEGDLPMTSGLAGTMAALARKRYTASPAFERQLFDDAITMLTDLASTSTRQVLLHGDFHHKNVLASEREAWLAIDPLPHLGEPEFDAVMFLLFRKGSMPDASTAWAGAIDSFCDALGLDSHRVKAWTFVRLVSDALAGLSHGLDAAELEAHQGDLWSARLVQSLM